MGSYQNDPSMMDMVSLNGNMHNILPSMDAEGYSDDMQMTIGNGDTTMLGLLDPALEMSPRDVKKEDSEGLNGSGLTGAGAGPLPTGFGEHPAPNAGSTLTEFTKRRNWSQRVLEELKDMLYILTPDGRLLYVSPSVKSLTGHDQVDLTGKFMSDYIHPDDSTLFIREFNESIATGNPLRFYYRFRSSENKYIVFESHGHPHLTSDALHHVSLGQGVLLNSNNFCRGFFMMARPYPTKNAELLDSFLEHKIENERLQARIEALKREEVEEAQASLRIYHKPAGSRLRDSSGASGATPSGSGDLSPSMLSRDDSADSMAMPPPAKPTISNTALTREALDEANAFSRPDSITDKMARYEGSSHVDSIEMLTGLRYREGERAHGISTGGTSPALIRGDAGIDIPASASGAGNTYADGSKKPKKVKSADEYVCTDCGTLDSPEWRKGPMGPKTLCNACGLRWAKKEKKRTGGDLKEGGGSVDAGGGGGGGSNNDSGGSATATLHGQSEANMTVVPGFHQQNPNGSG